MVSKMVMWQEPGKKLLLKFFAKLSVPLEQTEQKFTFMKPEIKRELKNKILEIADDFGLDEIITHSYVRQFDTQTQVSSIDMTSAISSLLEHPTASSAIQKQPNAELKTSIKNVHECLFDNFWLAYDALDLKQQNFHLLLKGIELAKEMQMAVIRIGVSLIEKKDVKQAESFRYCLLENSYLKDIGIFQYPLALRKLALFIMQAYKVSKPYNNLYSRNTRSRSLGLSSLV